MKRFGGAGKLKDKCRERRCVGSAPSPPIHTPDDPDDPLPSSALEAGQGASVSPARQLRPGKKFMKKQSEKVRAAEPGLGPEAVAARVEECWVAWMENQYGGGAVLPAVLPGPALEAGQGASGAVGGGGGAEHAVRASLGFARLEGSSFSPARLLEEMGSLVRVEVLGTGVVVAVRRVDWEGYSLEREQASTMDTSVDRVSFDLGLVELHAALGLQERGDADTVAPVPSTSSAVPVTSRKFGKLSRVGLQKSGALTAAAVKKFIILKEDGKMGCRECPNFTTDITVRAMRHARGHGKGGQKVRRKVLTKKHCCSSTGCGAMFARATELQRHYKAVVSIGQKAMLN
jgi:hypothetical protein